MNPAPHEINNLEIKELEMLSSFFIDIICLATKGGAG